MPVVLIAIRYVVPAVVVVAGVILFAFGPPEGAAAIVAAGLSIWLLNELYRLGVRGDQDRDAEDAARAYFDRYGHWPDEDDDST
jgi:hypothetical protein